MAGLLTCCFRQLAQQLPVHPVRIQAPFLPVNLRDNGEELVLHLIESGSDISVHFKSDVPLSCHPIPSDSFKSPSTFHAVHLVGSFQDKPSSALSGTFGAALSGFFFKVSIAAFQSSKLSSCKSDTLYSLNILFAPTPVR